MTAPAFTTIVAPEQGRYVPEAPWRVAVRVEPGQRLAAFVTDDPAAWPHGTHDPRAPLASRLVPAERFAVFAEKAGVDWDAAPDADAPVAGARTGTYRGKDPLVPAMLLPGIPVRLWVRP